MVIIYSPKFVRLYANVSADLQDEIKRTISLLSNPKNHPAIKVHKLHGKLRGFYGCSVNYKYRIVFEYIGKKDIGLITFGSHEIYK